MDIFCTFLDLFNSLSSDKSVQVETTFKKLILIMFDKEHINL